MRRWAGTRQELVWFVHRKVFFGSDIRRMGPAKAGGHEERLAAFRRLFDQFDCLARDETVPRIRVVGLEHDAVFALSAENLFLRRLLGGASLDDIDVPRA